MTLVVGLRDSINIMHAHLYKEKSATALINLSFVLVALGSPRNIIYSAQ